MTIHVETLIRSLGKTYPDLVRMGLITYQTKPQGAPGSPVISLDMAKEGVFLSFSREGQILKEITLRIQNPKVKNWVFPNELPSPLKVKMSRQWIHETLAEPDKIQPAKMVAGLSFGLTERYTLEGFHISVALQIRYDENEMVQKMTFLPTSELRW
ncbi:DUF6392 family protein [Enterobacteriaceae bacterium LUAb1]